MDRETENPLPGSVGGDRPSFDSVARTRRAKNSARVLAETVQGRIRDAILSAELRPNERLVENDLAEWLGVSRTPVREALQRLEQEGFVEHSRGWLVREYRPSEIRSRLECRLAVEGYAARLASQRRTEGQLQALENLETAMSATGLSRYAFNELNEAYHRTITEAADNPTLLALHAQTKMHYWDLNVPVVFSSDDSRTVNQQHAALTAAIEARDGDTAERIARDHVQKTLDIVLAELKPRA